MSDKAFAYCAIDLALFVNFDGEYSSLIKHIKMDDPLNYFVFKQLLPSLKYKEYDLRTANNPLITNIGNYDRQYPYRETEFSSSINFCSPRGRKGRPAKERMNPLGACLCSNTNSLKCPVKPYQVLAPWAKGVIRSQA